MPSPTAHCTSRLAGTALAALLAVPLLTSPPANAAGDQASTTVTYRLRGAVRHLVVGRQTHETSYDRDSKFGDWASQGESCDTRAIVLKTESKTATTQSPECIIGTGRWYSYYDDTTYTDASALQIDHVVPVKNVWVTGGWHWTQATRVAYYNDLDDPRTLVAVDSHDNESKGDQTPDEWLPPANDCRYVREFVSVKLRWQLTVTQSELAALTTQAGACPNSRVRFTPATIRTH